MNNRQAIGFIETAGLPAAIAAADAAAKSADVSVLGRENTKGGGLVTVKIHGDVSAVKAALEAAKAASDRVRSTHSVLVIARPGKEIPETFGANPETFCESEKKTVCDLSEPEPNVTGDVCAEQTEEAEPVHEEPVPEEPITEDAAEKEPVKEEPVSEEPAQESVSDESEPEEEQEKDAENQDGLRESPEAPAEPPKKTPRPRGRKQ